MVVPYFVNTYTPRTPSWVPVATGVAASVFADFTTEGRTNHYWYNGHQYASASAWYTAMVGGSFIRADATGTAWYTNSSKLLASVGANVLRFNYNPVSGAAIGALIEAAGTNLALWSRDMTQSGTWTASSMTTAQTSVGADGVAASATRLTATGSPASIIQDLSSLGSATRTYSVYLRRVTGSGTIKLTIDGTTFGSDVSGSLNSSTYTRVTISAVGTSKVGIQIGTNTDAIDADFSQLEVGATTVTPTSPIVTTTVAVTRDIDALVVTMPFVGFSAAVGSVVTSAVMQNASMTGRLWQFYTSTTSEIHSALATGGGTLSLVVVDTTTQATITVTGENSAAYAINKIGGAWAVNDFVSVANNGTPATDSAGTIPTGLLALMLGRSNNVQSATNILTWAYWPSRISNADLGTLTT